MFYWFAVNSVDLLGHFFVAGLLSVLRFVLCSCEFSCLGLSFVVQVTARYVVVLLCFGLWLVFD